MAFNPQLLPRFAEGSAAPARDSFWDLLKSSATSTWGNLRYGLPAAVERVAGTLTPEDEKYYQAWNAYKQDQAQAQAPTGAATFDDWWGGRVGLGTAVIENIATMLPQLAGSVAGAVGGGMVGGPAGALAGATAASTPFFAGSNASRALQETGGITQDQASLGILAAPVQAALDTYATRFIPGAGKLFGPLASAAEGNVVTRVGKQAFKGAGAGALTETGQQVGERFAVGLSLTSPEAQQEFLQAFSTAGMVGGVLGGIGGITRKAPNSVEDQQLEQIVDAAVQPQAVAQSSAVPQATVQQPEVQEELPLGPRFEQFPAGYQGDLFTQPTYAALEKELANAPTETLDAVIAKGETVPAPVAEAVKRERVKRTKSQETPAAEAVEQGLTSRSAEPQGVVAPVSANPEPTFENVMDGIRRNQDLVKLQGLPQDEFVAGVRTLLENNDARKGTLDLAERLQKLGLLDLGTNKDVPVEAPPVAQPVTTPAKKTLLDQALKLPQEPRDAFVDLLSPEDRNTLAQEALTEMGEQSSPKLSDTQAQSRSDAAMFERGASGQEVAEFDTPAAQAAYIAGQRWKVPETKSQAQTRATLYGQGKQAGLLTDGGKTRSKSEVGRVESQNPEFERRNWLIEAIDARQSDGTYRGIAPEEVEQLRRIVRDGATDQEVNDTEQALRAGLTLMPQSIKQPDRFKPAVVTRGAPRNQEKLAQIRSRDTREVLTERSARALAADAVQKFKRQQINKAIDEAYERGDIDARTRTTMVLRSINGRFQEVADALPADIAETLPTTVAAARDPQGVFENRMDTSRRGFLAGAAATLATAGYTPAVRAEVRVQPGKPEFQALLKTGNIEASLDWIRRNSANKVYRRIAQALYGGGGWDAVTMGLADFRDGLYGTTQLNDDGSSSILLYGDRALSEEVFLHEAIHAYVQQRWAGIGLYNERNERILDAQADRADEIVRQFTALWDKIGDALKKNYPELVGDDGEVWAVNMYSDPDEALSWIMTNPTAQTFLKSVDMAGNKVTADKSLWAQFVDWVRDLLGLQPSQGVSTALDTLMDAGFSVLHAGASVQTGDYNTKFAAELARQDMRTAMPMKAPRTVGETVQTLKQVIPQIDQAVDKVPLKTAAASARRTMLGWYSVDHMAKIYEDMLPEMGVLPAIDDARHATHATLAQMFSPIHQAYGQLKDNYQDRTQRLMRATEFGADPGKLWEDQPWLHNLPNAADIKSELAVWNNDINTLRRNGAAKVYEDLKALNDAVLYSETAMSLSNLVLLDPELSKTISGFDTDAMAEFRENPAESASPVAARDFWKGKLDDYVKNVQQFIDDFRGLKIQLSRQDQLMVEQRLAPIELRLKTIKQSLAVAQQHPYFHLGRHGDQFVSFTARNAKGLSDKVAVQKIAQAFADAGIDDIYVSDLNTRPQMYARFDTQEARATAEAVLKQLRSDGWLDEDADLKGGPRTTGGYIGRAAKPEWLDEWLSMVAANPIFDTEGLNKDEAKEVSNQKDRFISQMREMWLDTLSDTTLTKVMTKRKGTAGYARDMMRNYSQRYQMHALAIANLSAAPQISKAFENIRAAVNRARNLDDKNHSNVQTMFDIQNELLDRHYNRDKIEQTVAGDRFRATTNVFFLGLSPGYMLTQVTQLGVLLLPELGKKHGYAKSFGAIARHTGTALKIMSAVFEEGRKRGLDGIADMAITPGVLQKVGLTAGQEKFLHKMIASGKISIGSAARELGRVAEGEIDHAWDRRVRWATAMGLYVETATRLIAALAAQDLHSSDKSKLSAEEYAAQTLDEAMFNYAQSNTARKMGKGGVLGQYTPIATQFMQYSAQLMQKLYRETHKALGGDAEARQFLAGHFAAVTALAGTLGLPFASLVATATELLVDSLGDDDEPYDATAAWRAWLTEMFGETLGMTLARGVPRGMLNFDLSERVGEQDLMPFTDFITDRRTLKDSLEANAFQSLGAPVSMMYNMSSGLLDIANGDVIQGMQKALPVALSNLVKGGSIAATGEFKNARGETLPIEGDGWDALVQLLGLTPTAKAEYLERNRDYMELKTSATALATKLRNKIVRALLDSDIDSAREYVALAKEFDADNPDYAVLPDIENSLRSRIKKQAIAKALGMPLGVNPDDVQARELLAY